MDGQVTKNIAIALMAQEQMDIDTSFDFISMCGVSAGPDINLCLISPQRARKEIAKREAVGVASKTECSHILFIRDGLRFVPETLRMLMKAEKPVIGCKTKFHPDIVSTDLTLIDMLVFEKIPKPYFAAKFKAGTIEYNDDDMHFLANVEQAGFGVFSEDTLGEANATVTHVEKHGARINARHIKGGAANGEVIAIAFPADGLIYTHTVSDIAQLVASNIGLVKGFVLINVQTDRVEHARNVSQEIAKVEQATKLLFIDNDMRFPADTLARLFQRKKDIIGVNAVKRDGTNVPVFKKNLFGRPFKYKKGSTEQVLFIGMAVTLIDMQVFEKMEKPYFYANYEDGTDKWRGEDYSFCWEAKKQGIHIWCDVGLSKEIGHIGAQTYYLGVK